MMSTPEFLGQTYATDEIITYPLYDNPHNSITYSLVPILKSHWAEHFAEKGKESSKRTLKVKNRDLATDSNSGFALAQEPINTIKFPLQRSSTQIYLTWSYDPALRLQGKSDLGPQGDPERFAEVMNGMSGDDLERLMSGLSEEEMVRLMYSIGSMQM